MKLVVAVIPPERLGAVQDPVDDPAASIVAVSQVGDMRKPRLKAFYRGGEFEVPRPRLRLEIAVVNEALVASVVNAILLAGVTSESGCQSCGDVLVMPLDECVRIVQEYGRPSPQE